MKKSWKVYQIFLDFYLYIFFQTVLHTLPYSVFVYENKMNITFILAILDIIILNEKLTMYKTNNDNATCGGRHFNMVEEAECISGVGLFKCTKMYEKGTKYLHIPQFVLPA